MIARLYRGEERIDALDPRDRGLAYGDGVFETVLVHHGEPVWWDEHLRRLERGCAVLGIRGPDRDFLRAEAGAMVAGCARGVLKLIVTRGIGERGYARSPDASPTLAMSLSDAPSAPPPQGLTLRWCETRLAIQPRLAGIKHLNRLEQVLARGEWSDPSIHEGLLCDTAGRVVSATSANLFVLRGGHWLTPSMADCGIAGTCRAWLLGNVPGAVETALSREEVESAGALVLCNAVRGILPVAALGERRWATRDATRALCLALARAEPAFAAVPLS
ncbi:MAG TPA: aminodeoxychorismate lyase [Xanthomonadaceae bacterium]|jgi:4-amino-4-deoxychorismate lyase